MLRDLASSFWQFTPSLNLDFSKGVLPAGVTYSRSGVATRVNSSGLIETIAGNVPRFDYDPVTLACRGILREPIRTNLIANSEQFQSWNRNSGLSTGVNSALSPDGTMSADKLVEAAGSTYQTVYQYYNYAPNTTYTQSIFLKAGERTIVDLGFYFNSSIQAGALFNIATGVVISTKLATASVTAYPNGWYRCSVTATSPATIAATYGFSLNIGNASGVIQYAGDGTSGVYAWGAQLEAGAFATSYIPVTTASVTRNFETLSGPALGSWYNPVQGTILVDCLSTNYSTVYAVGYFRNAQSGDIMPVENNNSARIRNNGGAYIFGVTLNTWPLTTAQRKTVLAYRSGDIALARSGVLVSTSTATDLPTNINQFILVDANFTGILAAVKYYPFRLGNSIATAYSI